MGKSISNTTYERIERLRRRKLLCQHGSFCTGRARIKFSMKSWPLKRNEGELSRKPMQFCRKHAARMPQYGVNFEIIGVKEI